MRSAGLCKSWLLGILLPSCVAGQRPSFVDMDVVEFEEGTFDAQLVSKAKGQHWAVWAENSKYAAYYTHTRQQPPFTMSHLAAAVEKIDNVALARVGILRWIRIIRFVSRSQLCAYAV